MLKLHRLIVCSVIHFHTCRFQLFILFQIINKHSQTFFFFLLYFTHQNCNTDINCTHRYPVIVFHLLLLFSEVLTCYSLDPDGPVFLHLRLHCNQPKCYQHLICTKCHFHSCYFILLELVHYICFISFTALPA